MPSIAASHFFPRKIISEGGICAVGLCLSFPIYFCIRPPHMTKPVSFLLDKRSFHMQCLSCPRPSFAHQASACARSFVRVTSGRLALYYCYPHVASPQHLGGLLNWTEVTYMDISRPVQTIVRALMTSKYIFIHPCIPNNRFLLGIWSYMLIVSIFVYYRI